MNEDVEVAIQEDSLPKRERISDGDARKIKRWAFSVDVMETILVDSIFALPFALVIIPGSYVVFTMWFKSKDVPIVGKSIRRAAWRIILSYIPTGSFIYVALSTINGVLKQKPRGPATPLLGWARNIIDEAQQEDEDYNKKVDEENERRRKLELEMEDQERIEQEEADETETSDTTGNVPQKVGNEIR